MVRVGHALICTDPENEASSKQRTEVAMLALEDMLRWLDHYSDKSDKQDLKSPAVGETVTKHRSLDTKRTVSNGSSSMSSMNCSARTTGVGGPFTVAIYDATNSTRARRDAIYEKCKEHGVPVMFIESVCDNQDIITANIKEVCYSFIKA